MTSINKKKKAIIEKYNQEKLRNQAMKKGVTLKSPETVFLSKDTKFGSNVVINPYVVIGKKTKIGNNVEILPFTHIENASLESNVDSSFSSCSLFDIFSGLVYRPVNILRIDTGSMCEMNVLNDLLLNSLNPL